ncbi:MAG: thiopeptide-type bacteriocin biosynthesis protein [Bacteroidota bacterium]
MVKRSFIVGSEWLYYKVYTGAKSADTLLTSILLPHVRTFNKEQQLITKWFFIRYADPKHHLRIRFMVPNKVSQGTIIHELFEALQPYAQKDIVWKVQLDTYHRELERYGTNTMELSESLFCIDSEAIVKFLDLIEGEEGEQLRWLYGLRAVDNLLNAFEFPLQEKLLLLEGLKTGFGHEFGMSRPLKKQLDDKFRKEREAITHFITFATHEDYRPILDILNEQFNSLRPLAQKLKELECKKQLQVTKQGLFSSYIHMLMNRLFKSKNRLNEMVCYDFLYRYYKSTLARSKKVIG